jgi:hypothetical protein
MKKHDVNILGAIIGSSEIRCVLVGKRMLATDRAPVEIHARFVQIMGVAV